MVLFEFERNGKQFIDAGPEVTSGTETLFAPCHEQSAALAGHEKIKGRHEVGGDVPCRDVIQDHGTAAGELSSLEAGRIVDGFDFESLAGEDGHEGVWLVAANEEEAWAARDFHPGFITVIPGVGVVLRLDGGFVFEGTAEGQAVGKTGAAAAVGDFDLAVGQLLTIAENGQGDGAIDRASDFHFHEKRLGNLGAGRQAEEPDAEVIAEGFSS